MKISKEKIKEFQKIYRKHFNEEITEKKALELGSQFLTLLKVLIN